MRKNEQKQNRKRLNSQNASQKLPPLNKRAPQQQGHSLGNISHQDEGLVGLLYEYFIKNSFMDTLECFQRDCGKGFKPNSKSIEAFKQQMIQAFQQGSRDIFFTRFGQFVPISMRTKDSQTMKLQFYIQVYFFAYSIHPQLGKKRQIDSTSKQAFTTYLQGKGSSLAKSNQFLQYYALAYLPKPQEHPTFKTIFTKEWISQLKKRVIYFIQKLYPGGKVPVIVNIYDKFIERSMQRSSELSITEADDEAQIQQQIEAIEESAYRQLSNSKANQNQQSLRSPNLQERDKNDREKEEMAMKISELEEQNNQIKKFIENVKIKYQSLQNNYENFTEVAQSTLIDSQTKWFKITQQFYGIANNLLQVCNRFTEVSEQDAGIIQKISHKLKKYETFVHTNIEDLISDNNIDFSLFERPQQDLSMDFMRKNTQIKYQNLIQLDFNKIKDTLNDPNPQTVEKKCFLLDALKNRLVKTRGIVLKREVVLSIVMNDMLCFEQGDRLIKSLLSGQNEVLLVQACQFINALSKDYYGREYLARNEFLTRTVQILKDEKTDETVRMIVLSTLQQLSVRPIGQKNMIQGDVIKWIVQKLNTERDSMSAYVMQHTTALLVNLLLRKQGLVKSQQIKQQILQTLINLLEVQTTEIRSYVHGALYPLFSKKVFRQKAKEYGIQENIKYLAQNTTVELFVLQLKYLQGQLNLEEDAKEQQAQDDHDTDDIGDEEIGEDFSIEIDLNSNNIMGEQFLLRNYSLIGPDAISQLNFLREEVENTLKKKSVYTANSFYQRPSTNNPVIAPLRRNVSNNNSVYSNRSSNRILRSELNNRSNLGNNLGNHNTRHQLRQKLDTVQPDNSEKQMSVKDFVNQNENENENHTTSRNNVIVRDNNELPSQKGSRKREDSDLFPGFQKQKILQNESFSQQVIKQKPESIKPYENTQEYRNAFQTRARIVRTPPQN